MSKFDARDYIRRKYSGEKEEQSTSLSKTSDGGFDARRRIKEKYIGFDTFSDDLNAMNDTINSIYGGWQDAETMSQTKKKVEETHKRLLGYEDYRKTYGDEGYTDLSGLASEYQNVLDDWDSLTKAYGGYESADEFNAAVEAQRKKEEEDAKRRQEMLSADVGGLQTEISDLEGMLAEAKGYETTARGKKNQNATQQGRSRGFISGDASGARDAEKELSDYLESVGYSSVEDIEKAINEKRAYKGKATIVQEGARLASVSNPESENYDKDFAEKSKYVPSEKGISFGVDKYREIYDFINGDENKRNSMAGRVIGSGDTHIVTGGYEHMTDDEIALYNYYYNQFGKEKAREYFETIEESLTSRKAVADFERYEGKTATELMFGVTAGLDQFTSGVKNLFNTEDDYIPYSYAQQMSGLIREDLSDTGLSIGGVSVGQGAYDFITTSSNMLPSILASTVVSMVATPAVGSAVGSTLMGASASGNAYQEMLNLGYSKGQARGYSVLVGASEAALQNALGGIGKLGGVSGKLAKAVSGIDNGLARFAIQWGGSMVSEGVEEALQEVLTPIFKSLVTAEDIEAVDWGQVAYSGLLGALSGGVFEGASLVPNAVSEHSQVKNLGKAIRSNENVADVFDMASMSPEESSAYEAYTEYAGKKKAVTAETARDSQVGKLATKLEADALSVLADENATEEQKERARKILTDLEAYGQVKSISRLGKGEVKKVYGDAESIEAIIAEGLESGEGTKAYELATEYKAKVDSGKKLSAAEITRLVDATDAAVKSETEKAASERLTELGETGDVEKLADIIARKETGELLTSAEQKMLEESEFGSRVAEEVTASEEELSEASVGLSEEEATLFRENYSGGDVENYRASFDLVSELARNNYGADYILENKGVLSPRQVQNIYSKVVTEPRMASQRALDGLVSKYEGRLTYKSRVDDSVFDGVKGEKLWKSLNKRQKQAITFAKAFAKGAGINLKITYGEKYNGYYDPATNSIVIDARAGFYGKYIGEDAIIPTMSHELTHWAKKKAPELYAELSQKIFGIFKDKGLSEGDLIATEKGKHPEYTDDQARDEIIARACEDLFSMSESGREIFNSLSENEQKTLTEKIKEIIKNLVDWVNELLGLYESKSEEAGILRGYKDGLAEVAKIWDEMLASAVRVNAAMEMSESGVAAATTADVAAETSVSVADNRRLVKGAVSGQFRKGQDAVAEVEATEESSISEETEVTEVTETFEEEDYVPTKEEILEFWESLSKADKSFVDDYVYADPRFKAEIVDEHKRLIDEEMSLPGYAYLVRNPTTESLKKLLKGSKNKKAIKSAIASLPKYRELQARLEELDERREELRLTIRDEFLSDELVQRRKGAFAEEDAKEYEAPARKAEIPAEGASAVDLDAIDKGLAQRNAEHKKEIEARIEEAEAERTRLLGGLTWEPSLSGDMSLTASEEAVLKNSDRDMYKAYVSAKRGLDSAVAEAPKVDGIKLSPETALIPYESKDLPHNIYTRMRNNGVISVDAKTFIATVDAIRHAEDNIRTKYREYIKTLERARGRASIKIEIADKRIQAEKTLLSLEDGISKAGTTIVGESDIQFSEKTYREGGRAFLEDWLNKQSGIDKADIADILNQTDRIASLMRAIREGNDLPGYAAWADMEVVKDDNGEPMSVIVKNGDYKMNVDFSQVCKKRVALDSVLNAMVKSGDLSAYTLTETDVAMLNDIIKRHDFEIACALCFVDSKRYRVGAWAKSFCEGMDDGKGKKKVHKYGFNEMLRSLVPEGSKIQIDEFNFTGRDIADNPTKNLLSEADDSELDFSLIDRIMAENDSRSAQYRYAKAIKENPSIRKILNPSEIMSSVGLDKIRLEAPAVYALINGHQGTAKPKFAHTGVAYGNNILQASNFTPEAAKMVGGVRCQSFSDFMANMVVDYAQFISELAAKGLTSHSYTKEPLFVKLFGLTGMKINMSLVPRAIDMTPEQRERFKILKEEKPNKKSKAYKAAKAEYDALAENAGLDENGEYIWEDETFPYDIAMEIVEDRRYSANCGTIAVGISDKHILKLLADERISMVIPYHKSSLNHQVAMMRDIALYKDYTGVQNTRDRATGKKLDKDKGQADFDFYGDLYGVDGKKGTHDPKKTAKNYLLWCKANNYIPKFDRFAGDENYYKLLIDFRVYDVDGTYVEQQPVKAIYPENDEFQELILNGVKDKDGKIYGGLRQQQETSDRLDRETKEIVEEYRRELEGKYGRDVLGGRQYSEKDTGVSAHDIMGENERLKRELEKRRADIDRLKEVLRLEKKITGGLAYDVKRVGAVADYIRKTWGSKYDKLELERRLRDIYNYIVDSGGDIDVGVLEMMSTSLARDVLEARAVKAERSSYYDSILKDIRSARIAPNEGQKGDAKHRFGDHYIGKFRGRVTIANDGVPLDQKWSEWAEKYPGVFDKDISPSQQLVELYDIYDDIRTVTDVVEDYNMTEAIMNLAGELASKYWTLSDGFETTADKGARMAQEQRLADDIYYGRKMTEERRRAQERIKELRAEHRQTQQELRTAYEERIDGAKADKKRAMSELRETYKQKVDDAVEAERILQEMYYGRMGIEAAKKAKEDKKRAMSKIRETYKQKVDDAHLAERIYAGRALSELRAKRKADVARAKQAGRERLAAYRENAEKKRVVASITDNSLKLLKMLTDNTKDSHVPESLKGAVKGLLETIDASSQGWLEDGKMTQKDISLNRAFSRLKNVVTSKSQELSVILEEIYGSGIDDTLKEFVDEIDEDGKVFFLNAMSIDELKKLDKVVKILKATVNKVNMYHVALSGLSAYQHGIESMKDLEERTRVFDDDKKHFEQIKTKVYWNNLNPYYAFKNLGPSAQGIFAAFQDGQDKLAFLAKEIIDKCNDWYTAKEYKKWSETYFEFSVPQPSGKVAKFSMNVPQIMSLYCVIKQEDARRHILYGYEGEGENKGKGGGITIAETKDKRAVLKNIIVTEDVINEIISKLDGKEVGKAKGGTAKEVADKMQEYMSTRGAELGNEITMARWGVKLFGIENYFPIKVSDIAVPGGKKEAPQDVSASMLSLLNMSFTHARNKMSEKSVEIGDIFDVFSSHMSNMARYNSMALPVLDMYKWLNFKGENEFKEEYSLQEVVTSAFGEHAWGYLQTFLKDVSGATKSGARDNLAVRFFRNSKIAKVAGNIRVVALQFTSFIRAGAVMDNKYLLRALMHKPKIAKSEENCGIVLWKSLGYYDTDITRGLAEKIKHTEDGISKVIDWSLKGAEWADKITMGALWNACELEIRDTRKDLKVGSKEFNEAIAMRLREVIYRTQVVDSLLTRSQMMRSKDGFDKMLTIFGSENTLSFNLVTDVFVSTELEALKVGRKQAVKNNRKYITKAVTAYVATNIVTTLVQAMFDAFRDYDEDEKDEKYWAMLMLENFAVNSSVLAKIPFVNMFVSALQGFSSSRTEADWMEYIIKWGKEIFKLMSGDGDPIKMVDYMLRAGSDMTGIAAYNVYRDIKALLANLFGEN